MVQTAQQAIEWEERGDGDTDRKQNQTTREFGQLDWSADHLVAQVYKPAVEHGTNSKREQYYLTYARLIKKHIATIVSYRQRAANT